MRNRWSEALGWCTLSEEREGSKINWRESSRTRTGSIAFFLEASGQGLKSVKMNMENWGTFVRSKVAQVEYLFHQTDELRDDSFFRWKQFICHVGRARDQYSIAEAGLVAGGKERKEGRRTVFFTPLYPFNSDANEAESITDIKKTRKDMNKMQCTGFTCPQHKTLVQNFGRQVLMPLLRTSLCQKNAS